jgi:sugar/nucleoside kinase (ribokinase family)
MNKAPHIFAVGNAMVDLIVGVSDELLLDKGLEKGRMMLVDAQESEKRQGYVSSETVKIASGGSTGNTAAVIASLGGKASFVGKIGDDKLGKFYADDMTALGVSFHKGGFANVPTANCLAMITPDGERTMSTFLGACQHLHERDIEYYSFTDADIVFIEGYLLDAPSSRDAAFKTVERAKAIGKKIAVTLSDKNCVTRNLGAFYRLAESASILIGNDTEMTEFWKADCWADVCVRAEQASFDTVMTRGAQGSTVITAGQTLHASVQPVSHIADLIGAGDAFAGGYLYAHAAGMTPADRLLLGNRCAAVVVESSGARPHTRLSTLIAA